MIAMMNSASTQARMEKLPFLPKPSAYPLPSVFVPKLTGAARAIPFARKNVR